MGDQRVEGLITNSGTEITSIITVTAVTGQKANGGKEISAIIVPAGTPGMTIAPKYSKVGWNCSDTHALSFDDVRVPVENLLGERGRGSPVLQTLDEGRIAISALGADSRRDASTNAYAMPRERTAFGQPIGNTRPSRSRSRTCRPARTWRVRAYYEQPAAARRPGFQARGGHRELYSSTIAVDNARDATQIHGGYGFMNEYPVSRMWRDSKILEIGEGTSECAADAHRPLPRSLTSPVGTHNRGPIVTLLGSGGALDPKQRYIRANQAPWAPRVAGDQWRPAVVTFPA